MKYWTPPAARSSSAGEIIYWYAPIRRSSGTHHDTSGGWKKKNGHYHRNAKGGGEWEFFHLPDEWTIHYSLPCLPPEKALTFHLKPFSFKHTGLFPEQATNWDWFSGLIADAVKKDPRPDSQRY